MTARRLPEGEDAAAYVARVNAASDAERKSRPNTKSANTDFNSALHGFTEIGNYATNTAAGLTAAAKIPGMKILGNAGALQEKNLVKVGKAENLDDAVKVFKNPDGKTALALSESAAKYGKYIKGLSFAGTALSVIDEARYVFSIPDGNQLQASAASLINIVGNGIVTTGGFASGALLGTMGGPVAPVTVPVAAAGFGMGASKLYDENVAPAVRNLLGVPDPLRKAWYEKN